MPKSFASSLLLRRRRLSPPYQDVGAPPRCPSASLTRRACRSISALSAFLALILLATGCGGVKNVDYSAADVQAAFAAAGIPLYGPRQLMPQDLGSARAPAPSLRGRRQPLPAMLKGVRDAFFVRTLRHNGRPTVLRSALMLVFVYPREEQAQQKARSFADLHGAEVILHEVGFGYVQKGNVVVDYRVFASGSRIPGYLGGWDSVKTLNRKLKHQVTTALSHLR